PVPFRSSVPTTAKPLPSRASASRYGPEGEPVGQVIGGTELFCPSWRASVHAAILKASCCRPCILETARSSLSRFSQSDASVGSWFGSLVGRPSDPIPLAQFRFLINCFARRSFLLVRSKNCCICLLLTDN